MATLDAVLKALNLLADCRPGTVLPDGDKLTQMLVAYVAVLEPVPDDLLLRAAVIAARSPGAYQGGRPVPAAGELYALAADLADDAPDVDEAWRQARWLAAHPPLPADMVDLSLKTPGPEIHPRVRKAVEALGGMPQLDNLGMLRHQFEEQYSRLQSEQRTRAALPGGGIGADRQIEASR